MPSAFFNCTGGGDTWQRANLPNCDVALMDIVLTIVAHCCGWGLSLEFPRRVKGRASMFENSKRKIVQKTHLQCSSHD